MARSLISMGRHTNFKAKASLLRTRLADYVVVARAEQDEVFRHTGQLGHRLQESRRSIANDVIYVTPPYGHHAEIEYLVEHVPASAVVDSTPASSNSVGSSSSSLTLSNSITVASSISEESLEDMELEPYEFNHKDIQLDAYHRAILHLAREE